jgi:hypothetical protein
MAGIRGVIDRRFVSSFYGGKLMTRFDHLSYDDARSLYRKLARENHPDLGGDLRTMQQINAEYAEYSANYANQEARARQQAAHANGRKSAADFHDIDDLTEILRAKVETLLNISPELIVEVCGLWIWVTGETKAHHLEIKAIEGMRYAHEKQAWYFASVPSFNRTRHSMDEIRNMHGSQVFTRQRDEDEDQPQPKPQPAGLHA